VSAASSVCSTPPQPIHLSSTVSPASVLRNVQSTIAFSMPRSLSLEDAGGAVGDQGSIAAAAYAAAGDTESSDGGDHSSSRVGKGGEAVAGPKSSRSGGGDTAPTEVFRWICMFYDTLQISLYFHDILCEDGRDGSTGAAVLGGGESDVGDNILQVAHGDDVASALLIWRHSVARQISQEKKRMKATHKVRLPSFPCFGAQLPLCALVEAPHSRPDVGGVLLCAKVCPLLPSRPEERHDPAHNTNQSHYNSCSRGSGRQQVVRTWQGDTNGQKQREWL
jgi:hypothetical protein